MDRRDLESSTQHPYSIEHLVLARFAQWKSKNKSLVVGAITGRTGNSIWVNWLFHDFFSQILFGAKEKPWPKPLTLPLQLADTWIEAPKELESATEKYHLSARHNYYKHINDICPFWFAMDK